MTPEKSTDRPATGSVSVTVSFQCADCDTTSEDYYDYDDYDTDVPTMAKAMSNADWVHPG
jgi:hypothetical protein